MLCEPANHHSIHTLCLLRVKTHRWAYYLDLLAMTFGAKSAAAAATSPQRDFQERRIRIQQEIYEATGRSRHSHPDTYRERQYRVTPGLLHEAGLEEAKQAVAGSREWQVTPVYSYESGGDDKEDEVMVVED